MRKKRPQPDLIDDDSPEWTEENFARARPASEVLRETLPKEFADVLLSPNKKVVLVTLHLGVED